MPLYDELETRLRYGSALPSYEPEGVRLDPTDEMDLRALAIEAAKAGALGGAVGGGAARGMGLANQTEIERLNREFMIDRARRRARQGLGGTSLEDLGDYAGAVFSEEGRAAHTGAGRYIPYGESLPYNVQARLGVGGGDMAPVTLGDGRRVHLSGSDLLDPGTRLSIERRLADMVSGGQLVDPESMETMLHYDELLSRDATNPKFRDFAGVERPISDIDFGRSGISREYAELAHPYAKEGADFARSPAGEAQRSAQSRVNRANQLIETLKQTKGDEFLRPGRYVPVFTPEQRGYPLEDLSPGQTSRALHPADTAPNWNILDDRGLPAPVSGYSFDHDTSLYAHPEADTPRMRRIRGELSAAEGEAMAAIRAREALYNQPGTPWGPGPPRPTRMSRIGSALKSGIKGALSPVSILTDAAIGSAVGAGSALGGYAAGGGSPESAGLFTPPGPGYEGVASPELIQRIAEQKELKNEMERRRLLEQYRASGYDLDPNTRLRDLR